VLASGTGAYSSSVALNLNNPPKRDTATLPGGGYLVLAFETDNPGAWLMHCHIAFHISEGFGVQFLERSSEILSATNGAAFVEAGCYAWDSYVPPISPNDSGL